MVTIKYEGMTEGGGQFDKVPCRVALWHTKRGARHTTYNVKDEGMTEGSEPA